MDTSGRAAAGAPGHGPGLGKNDGAPCCKALFSRSCRQHHGQNTPCRLVDPLTNLLSRASSHQDVPFRESHSIGTILEDLITDCCTAQDPRRRHPLPQGKLAGLAPGGGYPQASVRRRRVRCHGGSSQRSHGPDQVAKGGIRAQHNRGPANSGPGPDDPELHRKGQDWDGVPWGRHAGCGIEAVPAKPKLFPETGGRFRPRPARCLGARQLTAFKVVDWNNGRAIAGDNESEILKMLNDLKKG